MGVKVPVDRIDCHHDPFGITQVGELAEIDVERGIAAVHAGRCRIWASRTRSRDMP